MTTGGDLHFPDLHHSIPQVERERVVLPPLVEKYDEEIGGRLSFKAINPKFLLKYDE